MVYLLQHLMMESSERDAGREAVDGGSRRLSYGDLDALSDKLASVFLAHGVERGDRIGIYLHKSPAAVAAIHGVLKAGAVYVPLDPLAPAARLAYIIRNCGIRRLVVSGRTAANIPQMFPEHNPVELVVVSDDGPATDVDGLPTVVRWSDVLAHSPVRLENRSIDTDLAYILYTSGSTGVPKGVMISHRTSLTFVKWAAETFRLQPADRLSSHAPFHFDLSIFDLFAACAAGSTMALVPDTLSTFPIRLADWIAAQRITVWYSVPSILSMLLLHGRLERHAFPDLRTVLFAGEVFPTKYLRALMAILDKTAFYNLYGPTETNVITYYKVPALAADQTQPIPIGKPCANMDAFAVSEDNRLVTKVGDIGELYGRGTCVADGYWGDPDKTRRSFITNPLQPAFEERVYRTGDLVGLDDNGDYVFFGRRDHMVKSRGYRIELGEIETALYSHPAIKEAAAVAVPDDLIGNRIVAFVVLNDGHTATGDALKRYCADRIPVYMVPETLEFRRELPKTSTGKIDRPGLLQT